MEIKLSRKTSEDIEFLDALSTQEIISWPIDFESNSQSPNDTSDILDLWIGGNKWRNTGHQFVQFGQDGCGSLFCLWFYPELLNEPPVVFLGSEGERAVVSNNLNDFILQIASGKLFYDGGWLETNKEEKEELDWTLLSNKVKAHTGSTCDNPKELSELAIQKHPNLSNWVESNIE